MPASHRISFDEVAGPIDGLVTKFGGRPNWLDAPAWPLSRSTGRPMRFIGQVTLDPSIFGPIPARMAYLFMTDEGEFEHTEGTWMPDSGENAVILQPGNHEGPTAPIEAGPTLYRMVNVPGEARRVAEYPEFAVTLTEFVDPIRDDDEDDDEPEIHHQIGGSPYFIQGDEYPDGGPWRLLLQLDSGSVPFDVNFGDMGVGYAFLSQDGTVAKFLWQCS